MFNPNAPFDQDFHLLRRTDLDKQLSSLFRYWDAEPMERAEFVGWAWVVAAASDFSAHESPSAAIDQLRAERDTIHQQIVGKVVESASVDLSLVTRRMYIEWLMKEIASAAKIAA